ncbi:MAG TPA: hypothetical protein VHN14_34525, partial [Kofleriaceae bacterium]|nr:hypothetical protein [Kofleriaceae bacterium]
MMAPIDLGLPDVRALPNLASDPERWEQLRHRMHRRVFLRSEGNVIEIGTPQIASGGLVERSAEVVVRFNRFYAGVAAAYYERPDLRPEHL